MDVHLVDVLSLQAFQGKFRVSNELTFATEFVTDIRVRDIYLSCGKAEI